MTPEKIEIDLTDLEFKVKVPEGCSIVPALRLPSGQLVELADLVQQDPAPVGRVSESVRHREEAEEAAAEGEARVPRAPSQREEIRQGAEEQVAVEAAEIDPEGIIREWDPDRTDGPEIVQCDNLHDWFDQFVQRKGAGHETCLCDEPKKLWLGFMDYTKNEHCVVPLRWLKEGWGEVPPTLSIAVLQMAGILNEMFPPERMEEAVDVTGELRELLKAEDGRARVFGADGFGYGKKEQEPDVKEVLSALWQADPAV